MPVCGAATVFFFFVLRLSVALVALDSPADDSSVHASIAEHVAPFFSGTPCGWPVVSLVLALTQNTAKQRPSSFDAVAPLVARLVGVLIDGRLHARHCGAAHTVVALAEVLVGKGAAAVVNALVRDVAAGAVAVASGKVVQLGGDATDASGGSMVTDAASPPPLVFPSFFPDLPLPPPPLANWTTNPRPGPPPRFPHLPRLVQLPLLLPFFVCCCCSSRPGPPLPRPSGCGRSRLRRRTPPSPPLRQPLQWHSALRAPALQSTRRGWARRLPTRQQGPVAA